MQKEDSIAYIGFNTAEDEPSKIEPERALENREGTIGNLWNGGRTDAALLADRAALIAGEGAHPDDVQLRDVDLQGRMLANFEDYVQRICKVSE